jgi:hypothetical protein
MQWTRALLGAERPLGLNIEPRRLENLRAAGEPCLAMNCFDVPQDVKFDYVFMSHFIEHLNSRKEVFEIIRRALRWARKGVYIAGPTFFEDDHIREYGVKFVWGDWIDHASRYDLRTFLPDLFDPRCSVSLGFPVHDSKADNIVALRERLEIESYEREKTVEKPMVVFDRPVHQEFLVFVSIGEVNAQAVHVRRHGPDGIAAWPRVRDQARRWTMDEHATPLVLPAS